MVFREQNAILCYLRGDSMFICMLFRNTGITRFVLPLDEDPVRWFAALKRDDTRAIKVKPARIERQLVTLEKQMSNKSYKFGVLYCGPNQHSENDMYGNTDCSPAFWRFMDLLAQRHPQRGWARYAGGLDTTAGTTGTDLYFTYYESCGYDVVFHVAPLLPATNDEQSLERKRHVGNDIVVLVFKEMADASDVFDPSVITSHFNRLRRAGDPQMSFLS